jgi:predicted transposase YdaD
MATPYDDTFKIFISENAQDFASWLVKGAQVQEKLLTEFEGRKLQADALLSLLVPETGEELLLQIECQSRKDADMPERLLAYHLRARHEHHRSVYSCVIYLRDDGEVEYSPLTWTTLGNEIMRFQYLVIEVAKMTADEFRQLGLSGLLPFMILTQGGATREVAEEIFIGLEQAEKRDTLAAAYTLVSLAFGKEKSIDQNWLLRRVSHMDDVLRDTPVYQEMTRWAREEGLREGLQEGLREGRQEGFLEGRQEGLQQALLAIVREHFPKLVRLAKKQIAGIKEPEALQLLIVKMSVAQSAEEAQEYLLEVDEDE